MLYFILNKKTLCVFAPSDILAKPRSDGGLSIYICYKESEYVSQNRTCLWQLSRLSYWYSSLSLGWWEIDPFTHYKLVCNSIMERGERCFAIVLMQLQASGWFSANSPQPITTANSTDGQIVPVTSSKIWAKIVGKRQSGMQLAIIDSIRCRDRTVAI